MSRLSRCGLVRFSAQGVTGCHPGSAGALVQSKPCPGRICLQAHVAVGSTQFLVGCWTEFLADLWLEAILSYLPLHQGQQGTESHRGTMILCNVIKHVIFYHICLIIAIRGAGDHTQGYVHPRQMLSTELHPTFVLFYGLEASLSPPTPNGENYTRCECHQARTPEPTQVSPHRLGWWATLRNRVWALVGFIITPLSGYLVFIYLFV